MAKYNRQRQEPESRRVKDSLRRMDLRPTKQRGQNFMVDPDVIKKIVDFGVPTREDHIVEIGPGLGALTRELAACGPLTAIEIDARLCAAIRAAFPSVRVIEADVRDLDLSTLGTDLTIFGNLPYVFSTDIVMKLIEHRSVVRRAVLLLQREFVERLAGQPGTRDYGSLSIALQLWADVKGGPLVSGDSFHPPTKVESQLVAITFRRAPKIEVAEPKFFERVVRAAFNQRRKKLSNSLISTGAFSREEVAGALKSSGISGDRRAETLTIEEFALLTREFLALRG